MPATRWAAGWSRRELGQSLVPQRTAASQVHLADEQGRTIHLKERIKHVAANCLKEAAAWVILVTTTNPAQWMRQVLTSMLGLLADHLSDGSEPRGAAGGRLDSQ